MVGHYGAASAFIPLLPVPECTIAPQSFLVHPSAHRHLRVHVVVDPHLSLLRVQPGQPPGVLDQRSLHAIGNTRKKRIQAGVVQSLPDVASCREHQAPRRPGSQPDGREPRAPARTCL